MADLYADGTCAVQAARVVRGPSSTDSQRGSNWSVRELERQIGSSLYERLALSRDKDEVRKVALQGQVIARPADLIKDPLVLEFLDMPERASYSESDLDSGGAHQSLNRNFIAPIKVGVPRPPEQRAIATKQTKGDAPIIPVLAKMDSPSTSPYTIEKHQHLYAGWAASRGASVLGCRFKVHQGRLMLESCGFVPSLALPSQLPEISCMDARHLNCSKEKFD